jgi:TolB protein
VTVAFAGLIACSDSPAVPTQIVQPSTHPILFSSNRSTGEFTAFDIYIARADGTDTINLTKNPANDIDAAWSPDGNSVAFASDRTGNYDIFVTKDDGTNVRQLTTDAADDTQPRWSPDGTKIVFTSKKDGGAIITTDRFTTDLFVMNADGTNRAHLTSAPRSDENSAAWSPDGRKIIYGRQDYSDAGTRTAGGGLFIMNADGSGSTRFQLAGADFGPGPVAWSPDGTQVAIAAFYNLHRDFFAQTVIVVASADGSNVKALTPINTTLLFNYPSWSADGNKILFTMVDDAETWGRVGGGYEYDIGVVNADGTGFTNLTPERAPDFSRKDAVTGSPQAWRK